MWKQKNLIYYLLVLLVLATLAILFSRSKERIDWQETYDEKSRQPYGTFVIHELLRDFFPGQPLEVLGQDWSKQLPPEPVQSNYVFIGEALYMDTASLSALLHFVEAGNRAFISSKTIPYDLMFFLYFEECNYYDWDDYRQYPDTAAVLNFTHATLSDPAGFAFRYRYNDQYLPYPWNYIPEAYFCELNVGLVPIGRYDNSLANFARVPYGKGFFYLHTVPLAFSNFSLLDERGAEYASRAFSHLLPGPIFFDRHSRIGEQQGRQRNQQRSSGISTSRGLSERSPLQYILSQPPLAWAWYLLLALGLLYVLFRAKRRQRIIPILEPNTNTSLEFLNTIGRLYFLQNNHRQLILQQMSLWQSFVRERYNLPAHELDESLLEKLAHKSGVERDLLDKTTLMYRNVERSAFVSENTLIEFHRLLERFYQTCK
jgi:hypothetical protein